MVHCLKLSPNLRRQSKEVKTALLNKDLKKAGEMEIKKLEQLLGQVREPENDSDLETESWNVPSISSINLFIIFSFLCHLPLKVSEKFCEVQYSQYYTIRWALNQRSKNSVLLKCFCHKCTYRYNLSNNNNFRFITKILDTRLNRTKISPSHQNCRLLRQNFLKNCLSTLYLSHLWKPEIKTLQ